MTNQMTTSQMEAQMNQELLSRNIPSAPLQPYLDVRPASTKYSIMPIVDPRKKPSVSLTTQPVYSTTTTFSPGNTTGPWSGYASNVNVESDLKNQVFALQNCDQSVYVPKSTSDLYQVSVPVRTNVVQSHSLLFKEERFDHCDPTPSFSNPAMFYNSTRNDTKGAHESNM